MFNFDNDTNMVPPFDLNILEDIYIVNEVIFHRNVVKNESLSLDRLVQILQLLAESFNANL